MRCATGTSPRSSSGAPRTACSRSQWRICSSTCCRTPRGRSRSQVHRTSCRRTGRTRSQERSVSSWRDRPTELLLGAAVVLTGVYFAVPRGNTQSVIYDVIGVGSAVAIAVGVRRNAPSLRTPWLLFALGNLCFAVADIIFNILVDPPVPSVADAFYLGGYPLLVVGLLLLLFAAGGHRRVAALADATIIVFAFILLEWVFVIDAIVDANGIGVTERAVTAAYPLMDIVLLAGLAGFFVSAAWRTPSFLLLVASIGFLLAADEAYGVGPTSYR